MGKNTNKKAKSKEVKFTIQKSIFKKVLEQNLKHIGDYKNGLSLLNGLKMEVCGKNVTFVSTDNNTLLESTYTLDEAVTGNVDVILQGMYLKKMKLCKDYRRTKRTLSVFDVLEFTVKENSTTITDVNNGIDYKIPYFEGQYPEYKKLIPVLKGNEDYRTVGLNANLLASLSGVSENGVPVKLGIKNGNSAIVVESAIRNNYLQFRALIMPCVIRE